jgi:hypothetical protein
VQNVEKKIADLDAGIVSPRAPQTVTPTDTAANKSASIRRSSLGSSASGGNARPGIAAPRPPSALDSDISTQYKFVGESSAIKREQEELTAKAVVLAESIDMLEASWKGKPMDKATLDVVTTLGLERGEILRKLESLQRQERLMELEKERKTRNRIISKTLRAVTKREPESSPVPLPDSVSNSEDLENEVAAAAAASAAAATVTSTAAAAAADVDDATEGEYSEASTASRGSSRSSRSSRHKHSGKSTRLSQQDGGASDHSDAHSPKLVRHRVRRNSGKTDTLPMPPRAATPTLTATSSSSKSSRPTARSGSGDEETSRPMRTMSSGAQTLKGSMLASSSIVDRLRAAAAAKELEKKKLLASSADAATTRADANAAAEAASMSSNADATPPPGFKLDDE